MFERLPGFHLLHQLQVEQTTPTGTVVFLAVMVAVFMLGAMALYAAAMTIIWYLRFRRQETPLSRVFLPSAEQFREHAAEYSLAVATSLILMLSLMAKHTTVEHLKASLSTATIESAANCRGSLDVGHLFPLHTCPQQLAKVGVANLLQLTADEGQTSEAEFIVERLYRQQAADAQLPAAWITDERLRIACLLLLLGHVLWLVRGRAAQLAASPDGGETPDYSEAARPLLALSLCAALLLLAAPAVLPTADNVASATIASIQEDALHAAAANDPGARASRDEAKARIEAAFESQRHNLSLLDTNTAPTERESIFTVVNRVRERVESVDASYRAEDDTLKGQIASLDETHRRDIEALRTAQNGDRDRLMAVDTLAQSQAAAMRELQDSLMRAQSSLQAAINGQQTRLGELQSALAQARGQIDQANDLAQSTRESLNGRVNELAGNVGQLQAALQRLNGQFGQQLQSVRADLTGDIRDEAQARAQLASRLAALEQAGQNTGAVTGNLGALNERIASVARGLSDLTARVNSYHGPPGGPVITRVPSGRDIVLPEPEADPPATTRVPPGARDRVTPQPQADPPVTTRVPAGTRDRVSQEPQKDPPAIRRVPTGVRERAIQQPQKEEPIR